MKGKRPASLQVRPPALKRGGLSLRDIRAGRDVVFGNQYNLGLSVEQAEALLDRLRRDFQPRPFTGQCPYVGLESFDDQSKDWFVGREALVEQLVTRLEATRALLIIGPSGSGKSSLARAGLLVALQAGGLRPRWVQRTFTPKDHPLDELSQIVEGLQGTLKVGDDLRAEGRTQPDRLHRWANAYLSAEPRARLMLVVDQFEELFTLAQDETERLAFINLLVYAATAKAGRVSVILVMRSDFVGACAAYPPLNALINDQQRLAQVGALSPADLARAVALPALRVGLGVDPHLIAQIVADMRGEPGALPLMQFTLKHLFEHTQRAGGPPHLTREAYLALGGLRGALQLHADAELNRLSKAEGQIARHVFSALVQPGHGTGDTRRIARFTELAPDGAETVEVNRVVEALAQARLITTDTQKEPNGQAAQTVTLAHEKLIEAWPWLHNLVEDNRERITQQNQIVHDAQAWERSGADSSYLYPGTRLAIVREQLAAQRLTLPSVGLTFVQAAVDVQDAAEREKELARQRELDTARQLTERTYAQLRAEKQAQKQTRRLLGVVAGLALLAVGVALSLFINRWQAENQRQTLEAIGRGPDLVRIEGGTATLGGGGDFHMPFRIYTIETFWLEPFEVTNARYVACMQAQACSSPNDVSANYAAQNLGSLPVVNVTALQAAQFCAWLGRRLPDEVEWEYTARDHDERHWPWGDDPDKTRAWFGYTAQADDLHETGLLPAAPEGIFDLAGNVWEWTRSDYDDPANVWTDLTRPPPAALALRGGSVEYVLSDIGWRSPGIATDPNRYRGFRCAADGAP